MAKHRKAKKKCRLCRVVDFVIGVKTKNWSSIIIGGRSDNVKRRFMVEMKQHTHATVSHFNVTCQPFH